MKTPLSPIFTTTVLLAAVACFGGCASQKEIAGHWRDVGIVINGSDDEWQDDTPQYYDEDQHVTVRVVNDAETLALTVATRDRALQRQLQMAGLTIWLDPSGGKQQIFGIHLLASELSRPGPPESGDAGLRGARRPPNHAGSRPADGPPAAPEPINEIEISGADTIGPLRLKMDEARRIGIDVGVGQAQDGRLVYEFAIGFSAAPSLSVLRPGTMVGIGILGASSEGPGAMETGGGFGDTQGGPSRSGGGMLGPMGGGGPPGGGMGPPGGGRSGAGPGKNAKPLEIWLKVRLAETAAG